MDIVTVTTPTVHPTKAIATSDSTTERAISTGSVQFCANWFTAPGVNEVGQQ